MAGVALRAVPGFDRAAEAAYDLVAGHRDAAMLAVRWLWGSIDRRPTYRRTRSMFLRGLGLVYLAAFGSLAVQVDGLMGSRGIVPAGRIPRSHRAGPRRPLVTAVPTLLWLGCLRPGPARALLGGRGRRRAAGRGGAARGLPGAALAGLPVARGRGAAVPGLPVGRPAARVGAAGHPAGALEPPARPGAGASRRRWRSGCSGGWSSG